MKELSIEEKARAFDNVREKIAIRFGSNVADEIFSEYEEPEDERIRKVLLDFLENELEKHGNEEWDGCFHTTDMIAWLEKQGKHESIVVIPKFRVGDVIRPKGSTAEYTIESISGECYHGKGWGLHISGDDDYELVGQKPAEWSVEDERKCNNIIALIEGKTIMRNDIKGLIRWLKSLKYRYTWKPNDEQMKVLWYLDNGTPLNDFDKRVLRVLIEQLMKLREE